MKNILLVTVLALNYGPTNCSLYTTICEFQEAYQELDNQRSEIVVNKVTTTISVDDEEESKEIKYSYDYHTEDAILALDGYQQAYEHLNSDLLVDTVSNGLGCGLGMFIMSKIIAIQTVFKTKLTNKDLAIALAGSTIAGVFATNDQINRAFGNIPYYEMPNLTKKENLFSYFNTPTLTRSAMALLVSGSTYSGLHWITNRLTHK